MSPWCPHSRVPVVSPWWPHRVSPRQCPHAWIPAVPPKRCPQCCPNGVPMAVSPHRCPPHHVTRLSVPGRTHSVTFGFSPLGTLSCAWATTAGRALHGGAVSAHRYGAEPPAPRQHPPVHGHLGDPESADQQICGAQRGWRRAAAGGGQWGGWHWGGWYWGGWRWGGWRWGGRPQPHTWRPIAVDVGGPAEREAEGGGAGEGAAEALRWGRAQPLALTPEDEHSPTAIVAAKWGPHRHVWGCGDSATVALRG